MTLALLYPTLRAAVRDHVLDVVDLNISPGVSVTLAQSSGKGVFTRASGSWITDGFAAGQEITVTGFGAEKVGVVEKVAALALTTDIAGAATAAGGGNFQAKLPGVSVSPQRIAWEGQSFFPTAGRPYVAESFRAGPQRRGSIASGTNATIQHTLLAGFSLFYPSERGTLAIERMAGALMSHFRPVQTLQRSGIGAVIENVERTPLITDGGWLQIAVTASLLAFTQS